MNITPEMVLMWVESNPKRYYKKGKIYGLISTFEGKDGILYISAMVQDIDSPFTKDMLKDIITWYNQRVICLITDVESKQGLIRRVLEKYNFSFTYKDKIMYSIGGLTWQQQQ
jgi:hypothetical protein